MPIKTVTFTGRRPGKSERSVGLPGGYDENHPLNRRIQDELELGIRRAIGAGADTFITGGALGVDTWAAERVLALKQEFPHIQLHLQLPFQGQESKWPAASQERYRQILGQADKVSYTAEGYSNRALSQRNYDMINQSDAVISVFEGEQKGGTWNAIQYAQNKGKPIWNINPFPERQAPGDAGRSVKDALALATRVPISEEARTRAGNIVSAINRTPYGFEQAQARNTAILNRADISKNFGPLQYSNAEWQSTSVDLPGSVQEELGSYVNQQYSKLHQAYEQTHPNTKMTLQQFVEAFPETRRRVASMPADLSAVMQKVPGGYGLSGIKTVGQVQDLLFNSVKQGFLSNAEGSIGMVDRTDIRQEMAASYIEQAPFYQRTTTDESGKAVNMPYQKFAQSAAFSGGRTAVRAESDYQKHIAPPGVESDDDDFNDPLEMEGVSRRIPEKDWLDNLADEMDTEQPLIGSMDDLVSGRVAKPSYARKYNTGLYTTAEAANGPIAWGGEKPGAIPVSSRATEGMNAPLFIGRSQAKEFQAFLKAGGENDLLRKSFNRLNESLTAGGGGEAPMSSIEMFDAAASSALRIDPDDPSAVLRGGLVAQEFDPYDQDGAVLRNEPGYIEEMSGMPVNDEPTAHDLALDQQAGRKHIADRNNRSFQRSAARGASSVNYVDPEKVLAPDDARARTLQDQAEYGDDEKGYTDVETSDIGSELSLSDAYRDANSGIVSSDIASRAGKAIATRGPQASIRGIVSPAESAVSARLYGQLAGDKNPDSLANQRAWVGKTLSEMRQTQPRKAANIGYIGAGNKEDAAAFSATVRQVIGEKVNQLGQYLSRNPSEEGQASLQRLRGLKPYQVGKEAEWGQAFAQFEATDPKLAAEIRAASGMPNEAQIYERLKSAGTAQAAAAQGAELEAKKPDTNPQVYQQGGRRPTDPRAITGRSVQARRFNQGTDPVTGGDRFSEGSGRLRDLDSLPVKTRRADPSGGGNGMPPEPPMDWDTIPMPEEWSSPQNGHERLANIRSNIRALAVEREGLVMDSNTSDPDQLREINARLGAIPMDAEFAMGGLSDNELEGMKADFPTGTTQRQLLDGEIARRKAQAQRAQTRTVQPDPSPLVRNPADFQRINPRQGYRAEYITAGEGGEAIEHVLEARRTGDGASAKTVWMEEDEDGNWKQASKPRYGRIIGPDGTVGELSRGEYEQWQNEQSQGMSRHMQGIRHQSGARSSATPEEKALAAVRKNVGVNRVLTANNIYGARPKSVDAANDAYHLVSTGADFQDQEVLSPADVSQAHSLAQSAASQVLGQTDLPTNPAAKIATIQQRILDTALEGVDKWVEEQGKKGVPLDVARMQGERFRGTVKHMAEAVSKEAANTLMDEYNVQPGDIKALGRNDTRLRNFNEVKSLLNRSQKASGMLGGRSAEDIWKSGENFTVEDEQGNAFDIGSGGKYGGGNRQPGFGGMWSGRMGSMMYGAYMLSRGWGMAIGPAISQGEAYGKFMSNFGFAAPKGSYLGGTDAGFTTRQTLGEMYMGRAAYDMLGGLMEFNYNVGRNPSAARMVTATKAAGTVAFDAGIAGSMMAMMSGGEGWMATVGKAMGPIGLGLGALMIGGTAAMEGYNNWFRPEDKPELTWDNLWGFVNSGFGNGGMAKQEANNRLRDKHFGWAYQARPESMKGLTREEWAEQYNAYQASDEELRAAMDPSTAEWVFGIDKSKEERDASAAVMRISDLTAEDPTQVAAGFSLQKQMFGDWNEAFATETSRVALARGMTSEQQIKEAVQYASGMGFSEGSTGFRSMASQYNQMAEKDPAAAAKMLSRAQRIGQYASQLETLFGADDRRTTQVARALTPHDMQTVERSLASDLVDRYNMNQMETGLTSSYLQQIQQSGGEITPFVMEQAASFATTTNPYVAQMSIGAMGAGVAAGLGGEAVSDIGSMFSNLSPQDANLYGKMLGGDERAGSYLAWQNDTYANRLYDRSGNMIWETNGAMAMKWFRANPQLSAFQKLGATTGMSDRAMAGLITGSQNSRILDAFLAQGTRGIEALSRIDQANASAALAGIQMRGLELQENFLWGDDSGGTWSSPSAHSAWGIEDQLRALQHSSTMAGFDEQQRRMDLSNDFAIRRENNQYQRMTSSHEFSQWQWSSSYNAFQQRQGWAREDWQYQDTMRNLSFGWGMEDLNEAIRFSSGRERRQLIRQRDRQALSHNLEEGQIENQRERQEELWAQEDERFQKQKQYMDEMQRLDTESFEINRQYREEMRALDQESFNRRVEEYKQEKELQDEMTKLNREYQYEQIQLQKEAAGIQAGAAAAQREYYEAMLNVNQTLGDAAGEFKNMNTYDNAQLLLRTFQEMLRSADGISPGKIQSLISLINSLNSTSVKKADWKIE